MPSWLASIPPRPPYSSHLGAAAGKEKSELMRDPWGEIIADSPTKKNDAGGPGLLDKFRCNVRLELRQRRIRVIYDRPTSRCALLALM